MRIYVFGLLTTLMIGNLIGCGETGPFSTDVKVQKQAVTRVSGELSKRQADFTAPEKKQKLYNWLISQKVDLGNTTPIEVRVTAQEAQLIHQEYQIKRRKVGLTKAAEKVIDFSTIDVSLQPGAIQKMPYGAFRRHLDGNGGVYSASVHSPGAVGIRLHFVNFQLPAGVELYLYNDRGDVFGPYTQKGPLGSTEFWSHTVAGPEVSIQVQYSGKLQNLRSAKFVLQQVGHIVISTLFGANTTNPQAGGGLCVYNASCVENAECTTLDPAIQQARDAIAHMLFVSGAYFYICSGGLVADSDPQTEIPYFLTANHCLSKKREASSLEAYFDYTLACGLSCGDYSRPDTPRTLGANIVATDRATDFTLLELAEPAPSGSFFLGWNSAPVAYTDGTPLFRISHPGGAPQAYSEHVVDTETSACSTWPRGDRIYSRDTFGATEGGSSGSPVLNANGELVGQLSGACGTNLDDVCDATNNATVDGAFAAYFDKVSPYLAAGSSCTDEDGDDYCVPQDCNDNDPTINPAAVEVCDDGLDNNCDGNIDEGCGTCLPLRALCTQASQCCSSKCVGKPGSKTCK